MQLILWLGNFLAEYYGNLTIVGYGLAVGFLVFIFIRCKESFKVIQNIRAIIICGLITSISVVLGMYSIMYGNFVRVGMDFVGIPIAAYLFGGPIGAIVGAAIDLLKFVIRPQGPYLPAMTLSIMVAGGIYGLFLYNRPITFWRILAAKTVSMVVVSLFLNTMALYPLMGGRAISVWLPARVLVNIVALPIESFLLYFTFVAIAKAMPLIIPNALKRE